MNHHHYDDVAPRHSPKKRRSFDNTTPEYEAMGTHHYNDVASSDSPSNAAQSTEVSVRTCRAQRSAERALNAGACSTPALNAKPRSTKQLSVCRACAEEIPPKEQNPAKDQRPSL
ncbi:unnamed protein product [Cochlearia groenlandica]